MNSALNKFDNSIQKEIEIGGSNCNALFYQQIQISSNKQQSLYNKNQEFQLLNLLEDSVH